MSRNNGFGSKSKDKKPCGLAAGFFIKTNAYKYGRWIGQRYKDKTNIIGTIGGDRAAVYGDKDYRTVFRALAEGGADGINDEDKQDGRADYGTTFMTYHPRKSLGNSS